jgi:hypothetical protein
VEEIKEEAVESKPAQKRTKAKEDDAQGSLF